MTDFSSYKVPVFPNINDTPRVPTAQQAGNGSDLINRFNSFVDTVQSTIDNCILASGSEPILSQDTIWYVDSAGLDDSDGLTPSSAFATLKKASLVAASYLNPNRYTRTIQLAAGTYNGASLAGFFCQGTSDYIKITGNDQNTPEVIIQGTDCISFTAPGIYYLTNMTLKGSSGDGNALCVNGARIKLGALNFGLATKNHINGWNHATIEILENYTISDSAGYSHYYLDSLSFLDTTCVSPSRVITMLNSPSFLYFAALARGSFLSATSLIRNGDCSGKKYRLSDLSNIVTDGTITEADFPGNQPGLLEDQSRYI